MTLRKFRVEQKLLSFHEKTKRYLYKAKYFDVIKMCELQRDLEILPAGDVVLLEESRPYSKNKKWQLKEILKIGKN